MAAARPASVAVAGQDAPASKKAKGSEGAPSVSSEAQTPNSSSKSNADAQILNETQTSSKSIAIEHKGAEEKPTEGSTEGKQEEQGEEEEEEEEEEEKTWWYLDNEKKPQGPFSWEEMETWFKAGYLATDLPVMTTGDMDFEPLYKRAEFANVTQGPDPVAVAPFEFAAPAQDPNAAVTQVQQAQAMAAWWAALTPVQRTQYRDYTFTANFNLSSGRFQAQTTDAHFRSKGVPADSAGRQLAHYFDIDAWQEQKRQEKELGLLKPKKVKNWRALKDAKDERKKRSYVKSLLKD